MHNIILSIFMVTFYRQNDLIIKIYILVNRILILIFESFEYHIDFILQILIATKFPRFKKNNNHHHVEYTKSI